MVSRYGEIISVLAKYGLAEFVSHRPLLRKISIPLTRSGGRYRPPRLVRESFAQRLRRALEELGPSFIKLGQILSDRADLLPKSVIHELQKLQDAVPPISAEEARARVQEELGRSVDELFLMFYDEPEGAASLAQVHRAILPTGRTVAVKIKRPGIDDQIRADLEIMRTLAQFLDSRVKYFEVMSAVELVEEFSVQILKELDFVEEFLNLKKFADDYEDDPTVAVPYVYEEFTTHGLLVQEFMHAQRVSDVIEGNDPRFDKKLINRRTADFIMAQLFINGFFHADPHPGNFLVLDGNVICFIDFGMVYSLRPHEQDNLNLMMAGLSRFDSTLVARSLLKLGRADAKVDTAVFQSAVHDYIELYLDRPIEYVDLPAALMELLQMVVSHGVRLPPRLVYVAKVLGSLQTIGKGLDPDFNLLEYLREFSPRIWANQFGSKRAANRVIDSAMAWGDAFLDAPDLIQNARRFFRDRRLQLDMPQADTLSETVDRIGFRLSFGMVLSALLIASALMVHADIEPKVQGVPLFGIVGFAIGGVMGIGFLFVGVYSFFKHWQRHRRQPRPR